MSEMHVVAAAMGYVDGKLPPEALIAAALDTDLEELETYPASLALGIRYEKPGSMRLEWWAEDLANLAMDDPELRQRAALSAPAHLARQVIAAAKKEIVKIEWKMHRLQDEIDDLEGEMMGLENQQTRLRIQLADLQGATATGAGPATAPLFKGREA